MRVELDAGNWAELHPANEIRAAAPSSTASSSSASASHDEEFEDLANVRVVTIVKDWSYGLVATLRPCSRSRPPICSRSRTAARATSTASPWLSTISTTRRR